MRLLPWRKGAPLLLLHSVALRDRAVKPRWAMRAEAAYWLLSGDLKLARLFWRDA